jgi:hypothetical protein
MIMGAVRISETAVYFNEATRRHIHPVIFILAAVRT